MALQSRHPGLRWLARLGLTLAATGLLILISVALEDWRHAPPDTYWGREARGFVRAKRIADRYLFDHGFGEVTWAVSTEQSPTPYEWAVVYWRTLPANFSYLTEDGDLEVHMDRRGQCHLFDSLAARHRAQALLPLAVEVAEAQCRQLGVDPALLTKQVHVRRVRIGETVWGIAYWRTSPDDLASKPYPRGEWMIYVDDQGRVVGVEHWAPGTDDYDIWYRQGFEAQATITPYAMPSEQWRQRAAALLAATPPPPPPHANATNAPHPLYARADAVLRQHGYDPVAYHADVWHQMQWRVDYWLKKDWPPKGANDQPRVVVFLGDLQSAQPAEQADRLIVPLVPWPVRWWRRVTS